MQNIEAEDIVRRGAPDRGEREIDQAGSGLESPAGSVQPAVARDVALGRDLS